ncbi:hypothetical protein [Timonella senegalensis]|uniref:hypothetical protein n=1 Tax=Timonella senegalensis TaxID=1465825 RepID=UPI000593C8A9|nr:hypothetical protein [Timonella senegalensis]
MHAHPALRITFLDSVSADVLLPNGTNLRLTDLLPLEREWLKELVRPESARAVDTREPRSARRTTEHIEWLSALLEDHGALRRRPWLDAEVTTGSGAHDALSLRSLGLDAARVFAARGSTGVVLRGLNSAGLYALRTLAAGGIKRFLLDDALLETPGDTLPDLVTVGARELPLRTAMVRELESFPGVRIVNESEPVHFALVGGYSPAHRMDSIVLQAEGIPHVFLGPGEGDLSAFTLVGPLVLPYEAGCLTCDGAQSFVAQFHSLELGGRGTVSVGGGSLGATIAGGFAAAAALQVASGVEPSLHREVIAVDGMGRTHSVGSFEPDAECMCATTARARALEPLT